MTYEKFLQIFGNKDFLKFMLNGHGLSLSDHYWIDKKSSNSSTVLYSPLSLFTVG